MKTDFLIEILKKHYELDFLSLEETECIPHLGIYYNKQVVDPEHDYNSLSKILKIQTNESGINDYWKGTKYLFLFSEDGENISDWKLMGESDKITKLLIKYNI